MWNEQVVSVGWARCWVSESAGAVHLFGVVVVVSWLPAPVNSACVAPVWALGGGGGWLVVV